MTIQTTNAPSSPNLCSVENRSVAGILNVAVKFIVIYVRAFDGDRRIMAKDELLENESTVIVSRVLAADSDDTPSRARPDGTEDKLMGTLFAQKYQITEFLGRGGMSVVYKARHIMMDKHVALKILHSHLSEDTLSVRRFKQEAQAASSLAHPSIVSVRDFGEDENGTSFLVMDFIDGVSLSRSLRKNGPLTLERFLNIMQQVSSAMEHAHQKGIIHRDLKPSNIMLSSENGKEVAKIVDFGIAKIVTHGSEAAQQLTQTGELFGSPLYMSPEQCSGTPLDRRSDIYAFGCVMFEALSGKAPFIGETMFETINHQLNTTPPPLEANQIDSDTKQALELIILKAMAKVPADRFQNAAEIESQLRSMSLSSRTGVFARIGGAWELANAKRAARKKTKLPLLVSTLTTVSVLSMVSTLALLGAFVDSDFKARYLSDSRQAMTEQSLTQLEVSRLSEQCENYVTHSRTTKTLGECEQAQALVYKRLEKLKGLLKATNKKEHQRFLKLEPEMHSLLDNSMELIQSLPISTHFSLSDLQTGLALKNNRIKALALCTKLSSGALNIESIEVRAEKSREWVLILALLCVVLNGAVVIGLITYFARGTPKRLKELAENAARLSSKRESAGDGDDIAELDLVLQELATALSEAEQREKALLSVIRENSSDEKDSTEGITQELTIKKNQH